MANAGLVKRPQFSGLKILNFALSLMKKCTYCGKEYPDEAQVCAIDQRPLVAMTPPTFSPTVAPLTQEARQIIDNEHIKMLCIFNYVMAGLCLVGLLVLCLHFALMAAVFTNPGFASSRGGVSGPPLGAIIGIAAIFYLVFGCLMAVIGFLNFLSAQFMRKRVHRTFSMTIGGLNCLSIPFGTILGVFTFLVLSRVSVVQSYEAATQRSAAL